ncbi:YbaB/EbfC family nucleoid-associated protein [Nocardia brasiliensis]|uniref:YbaB/EbfC family nucleoid-associated protein n=1 Tax=Nocardia brasiliensis TaxID=37326 RepID=UPI00245650E6|nr:YbaB/EbfC family nucleoid-associated protein [Nocardia brasiliensis]
MPDALDNAISGLAQWSEDLERKAQRFRSLQDRMDATTATETSDGNRVSVTVDSNGVPVDIQLSGATRGMDPTAVSAELMATLRRAHAKLRREVTALVHDMVGDDAIGANVLTQYATRFPDDVPETPTSAPRSRPAEPADPDDEDEYYRNKKWLE